MDLFKKERIEEEEEKEDREEDKGGENELHIAHQ